MGLRKRRGGMIHITTPDFLENETVGFDENLPVFSWYVMQQCVMLSLRTAFYELSTY